MTKYLGRLRDLPSCTSQPALTQMLHLYQVWQLPNLSQAKQVTYAVSSLPFQRDAMNQFQTMTKPYLLNA